MTDHISTVLRRFSVSSLLLIPLWAPAADVSIDVDDGSRARHTRPDLIPRLNGAVLRQDRGASLIPRLIPRSSGSLMPVGDYYCRDADGAFYGCAGQSHNDGGTQMYSQDGAGLPHGNVYQETVQPYGGFYQGNVKPYGGFYAYPSQPGHPYGAPGNIQPYGDTGYQCCPYDGRQPHSLHRPPAYGQRGLDHGYSHGYRDGYQDGYYRSPEPTPRNTNMNNKLR